MENQYKTNADVLDWIKGNEGKSQLHFLDEVQKFFGFFSGRKKKLNNIIRRLKEENKKRKRNAHKALMKQCGGTGKEGNIPPTSYLPDCFVNSETCRICEFMN